MEIAVLYALVGVTLGLVFLAIELKRANPEALAKRKAEEERRRAEAEKQQAEEERRRAVAAMAEMLRWERARRDLALTCLMCRELAEPIRGTGNRYRCVACTHQFAGEPHGW